MTNEEQTESRECHELFVRYFDDALTDEEHRELNELLESSHDARELFNEMVLQSQIIADAEVLSESQPITPVKLAALVPWLGVVGIAVAILLVGLLRGRHQETAQSTVVAKLVTINGVAGPDGDVTVGTTIYTRGVGSSARLVFLDGTEVVLDNDSRLSVGGDRGKDLRLLAGHVTAIVARQPPARPLRLYTEHALAEVLGTSLTLDAEDESTALSVLDGVVRLQRLSDKQAVNIHAGQYAVTDGRAGQKLNAQHSPPVPDEFSLRFQSGLPSGWRVGRRVQPSGSGEEAFVRAEAVKGQPRGTHFQVYTQNAFYDGMPALFRIHDDTYLHLTYRMEKPGWFQIFVGVRPHAGASAQRANFLLQPSNEGLEPGHWRTLHIPFSRLRNLQGDFDAVGKAAYFILLDTQVEDRGLDVQRIWVNRKVGEEQKKSPS